MMKGFGLTRRETRYFNKCRTGQIANWQKFGFANWSRLRLRYLSAMLFLSPEHKGHLHLNMNVIRLRRRKSSGLRRVHRCVLQTARFRQSRKFLMLHSSR